MERLMTTVTQRGQVTLPVRVRRILGVKPRETVTFEIDGDHVRIVPTRFTVESVRGSAPALDKPATLDDIFAVAAEEHARHVIS